MEIDFRTAREALIYEVGLKTGIIQREYEKQKQAGNSNLTQESVSLTNLQKKIDFIINVIKGL